MSTNNITIEVDVYIAPSGTPFAKRPKQDTAWSKLGYTKTFNPDYGSLGHQFASATFAPPVVHWGAPAPLKPRPTSWYSNQYYITGLAGYTPPAPVAPKVDVKPTPKPFTDAEVTNLLAQAVAEKGWDYTYPNNEKRSNGGCNYVTYRQDAPACIVGNVAHRMGASLKELLKHEGRSASALFGGLYADFSLQGVTISPAARSALQSAQTTQDGGATWGDAFVRFTSELAARTA